MGVGLESGLVLDEESGALEDTLDRADVAARDGDLEAIVHAAVILGETLFAIEPFVPIVRVPDDWHTVLHQWLSGEPVDRITQDGVAFIEEALLYRLVWALESLRVRRLARGRVASEESVAGMAAGCLETGLPDFRMALMVRAGLPSRKAARFVVEEQDPAFDDVAGLRDWLRSVGGPVDWPSPDLEDLWGRFRSELLSGQMDVWEIVDFPLRSLRRQDVTGRLFRLESLGDGRTRAYTPDYHLIGELDQEVGPGLVYGEWVQAGARGIRIGPSSSSA